MFVGTWVPHCRLELPPLPSVSTQPLQQPLCDSRGMNDPLTLDRGVTHCFDVHHGGFVEHYQSASTDTVTC